MSDEQALRQARKAMAEAIQDLFRSTHGPNAVLTGWYVVARGSDGADGAYMAQDWSGDIITQIGLTEYAREHVRRRAAGNWSEA